MTATTLGSLVKHVAGMDAFEDTEILAKVHVREGDVLLISGSLIDGSGTPTSDFDFCVIAPELDDRFDRESFPSATHMRYYTQGHRVKESFDYLPNSLLGVNVEYWTRSEIQDLIAAHHRLYEYMTQRARKSSAFGATRVDFRMLSRLTFAVPLVGADAFTPLRAGLRVGEVCYTAFRTAVGSYPDFRDFSGMYAQGDYELALVAARKLGTDTVRGLTHLYGNTNRNPKYLRRFMDYLPVDLAGLAQRFRTLQLADLPDAGGPREACLAWLDLVDDAYDAIREARDERDAFPSRTEFLEHLQAELHASLEWTAELRNEYAFRAREAVPGMPQLRAVLDALVAREAADGGLPLEAWAAGRRPPLGENNQTDL